MPRSQMATLDATLMFALPAVQANRPYTDGQSFRSRREHLDSKLCALAGGFTCIEAKGVWKGIPEAIHLVHRWNSAGQRRFGAESIVGGCL